MTSLNNCSQRHPQEQQHNAVASASMAFKDEPPAESACHSSGLVHNSHNICQRSEDTTMIDASVDPCCWILSCPFIHCGFCPYQTVLTFENDAAIRHDRAICGERTLETPYGEMRDVEMSHCMCLICVDSGLGTVLPGMGCDKQKTDLIFRTLQSQMKARGEAKQMKLVERILERTDTIHSKLELVEAFLRQQNDNKTGGVPRHRMSERS